MAKIRESKERKQRQGNFCRQLKNLALIMLAYIRFYLDLFIDKLFGLYYNSKVQKVPPVRNKLLLESATSLAHKIKKREISSEEVVKAFIDRIHEVNSIINAVVDERFDEAIEEAQDYDRRLASGDISETEFPFLGVPFTTKESTLCYNLSNSFGLLARKNSKATFDATIVANTKAQGAILVAVTNVPQINLWQETFNPVFGITKNPFNTTRTVGGSSGGEGAIIAACGSPIGLGTDIGGSLRIPAFSCGIFAHKPTSGMISSKGLTFRDGTEGDTMVVPGPMAKHCEDLIPLLKAMIGSNKSVDLDTIVDLSKIRFFYMESPRDPYVSPIRDEMNKTMLRVIRHVTETTNLKPELINLSELKFGGKLWRYWMSQEPNANFNRDLANREGEINSFVEIFKYIFGCSDYNIAVMANLVNNMLPAEKAEWAREVTEVLTNKLSVLLGTDGVLFYPSAPFPASYHYSALLRPWNMNLFGIWNALKFPVTQVPLGLGEDGLPLGIQVVTAPSQDRLSLAVARNLEKAFGGYVPPS